MENEKRSKKPIFIIILIAVLAAVIGACLVLMPFDSTQPPSNEPTSPETSSTAPSESTEPSLDTTQPSTGPTAPDPTDPTIDTADHQHDYDEIVTSATCTEEGYTTYTCICGDSYVGSYTTPAGHQYATQMQFPTCTEEGYTTYTCTCGDSYTGDIVPAAGHQYSAAVTAPTCTQEGYTTYTCFCGDSYIGAQTEAAGHRWGSWKTITEPTETAEGLAQRSCTVCKVKESRVLDKVIPDHTHSYTASVTKEPTCTAEGIRTYTCSCGGAYTEAIARISHSYSHQITQPTCTAQGYTTHTCKNCSRTYIDNNVAALGHSYQETVTAPTCTKGGYTTHTCKVCAYSFTDSQTSAAGHTYQDIVTAPTCTKGGYTTHTCKVCAYSFTDSRISAAGHTYQDIVTAPTCTKGGYTTHTCKVCSHSYTDKQTSAMGHSYALTATVAATCTQDGSETYTCTNCPDSYKKTITGSHRYQSVVTAPTCTEGGYTTYTCSACSHSYTDSAVAATGHRWSRWQTVRPTCTQAGYSYRSCSGCTATETEAGNAAYGHSYSISGEKDGKFIYACWRCSDSYSEDLETRYDASLAAPAILSVHAKDLSVSINCEVTFEDDSGYGYQCIIAKDTAFTKGIKSDKSTRQWNGSGYVHLSFFYTYGSYYYKVRTYKMEGETFVYGPWSAVGTFSCLDYDTQLDGSSQYSYEVYFLDNLGTDVYTELSRPIYIKTDNPSGSSIRLTADGQSIMRVVVSAGNNRYYDDVEYLDITDNSQAVQKVPGGYLAWISPETTGTVTVELREATPDGYYVAKTITLNVLDYDTERNKWIDDVIAAQTNSSMTPKQKMDAIAAYLKNCGFRYLTNVDGNLVTLAAQPNSPWFLSKRWDSATSPAMLARFAERIGGFEEVHNCYADYPRGTTEWFIYHHQTYVVYGGQKYYYTVCPYTDTGDVGTVEMIDFSNTSKLTFVA